MVDDEDYSRLSKFSWWYDDHPSNGYAVREIQLSSNPRRRKKIRMHQDILNIPSGMVADHIDFNKLNNQKSNLRAVSKQINNAHRQLRKDNTTGLEGVTLRKYKTNNRFRAQVGFNGKRIYLGEYATPEKAYEVYKKAFKNLHKLEPTQ